jgi:hypothetical protein
VPQSSARPDLAPEAFLSSSDDFLITTPCSSGPPLSQIYNLPDASLAREDAKTQAVKHIPKSMPRLLRSRLVPELLDQALTQSDEASLDKDDPPCAPGKVRKGRRPNDIAFARVRVIHRALTVSFLETLVSAYESRSSPHLLTSILVVSSLGRAALEGQDHDF